MALTVSNSARCMSLRSSSSRLASAKDAKGSPWKGSFNENLGLAAGLDADTVAMATFCASSKLRFNLLVGFNQPLLFADMGDDREGHCHRWDQ